MKERDVVTGIISNFDDRLGKHSNYYIPYCITMLYLSTESIVHGLELHNFFDFVVSSYQEKCHKPNSR